MSEQAERDIETVRKWLDGGCGSWGLPSNAIRRILDRVSLPASAEGGEAIDFVQELYSELRHQVNNCPVCKGEGMAVDVFDVLTKPEPREKTPCNRCSRARSLLDRVKPARTTLSEAKTHG